MDLTQIAAQTTDVEIKHPATFEPIGLLVKLRPMSSPEVRAVQRRITNENLRSRQAKLTAEKLDASRNQLLEAAVADWKWSGTANLNGETPKCTVDAVRELLKIDWIRDQLDTALGDESLFFQS